MPAIKFDTTLMRLIKDMQEVRAALRHVTTNLPLYDVANENTPASLSTDQNDYVPGNYDVLRINATANVSITGISGGKKGRFLEIINVGTGRISFPDESASSVAANRIATPYDQTITLLPNARARFYYDETQSRWTVADLPNIQGKFGKYAILSHSSTTVQTVAAYANTKLLPDTVISDEWSYWNSSLNRFIVPSGESGLYYVYAHFRVYDSGVAETYRYGININTNTAFLTSTLEGLINGTYGARWELTHQAFFNLRAGDYVEVYFEQQSTGNIDVEIRAVNNPMLIFAKIP